MAQIVNKLEEITELLQYFTGEITTTTATRKYACADIGVGVEVGDTVVFSGFDQADSNGEKTIATIASDDSYITVSEAIGTGETKAGCKMNQSYSGAWQDVGGATCLIGTIRCSGAMSQYWDWSWDVGAKTIEFSSAANTVTGGTAEIIDEIHVIAPFVRIRLVNTDTDQTVMSVIWGSRDY